jgi:hypothetical protein
MILQVTNIACGLSLAAPTIKRYVGGETIGALERRIAPYMHITGAVELALGAIGLLHRIGLVRIDIYDLGASYPQSIPAILMGLVLATFLKDKYPFIKDIVVRIDPYRTQLGFLGIAVGLGSLLFGCVLPFVCGQLSF